MKVTYQKETFRDIMPELPDIFFEHWEEIAHDKEAIKLDPDWVKFLQIEASSVLHVLTVRDEKKKLVGYAFGFVYPHLNYKKTLYGHSHMFYLAREAKTGLAGGVRLYKMLGLFIKMMRDLGVKKLYIAHKVDHDLSFLFERLGMTLVEKVHQIVF